jgi:glutamine amidotransferase
MPRIAIVDYGVGNLRSVERALARAGAEAVITPDPRVVAGSDGVVLPGVGAFAPAAALLLGSGLGDAVREAARRGRPVLGVCLGFQLLFESSEEGAGGSGLGLLPGRVRRIAAAPPLKVPHMGWNSLRLRRPAVLTQGVEDGTRCYFVHSYAADADPGDVVATVDYGGEIVAICERGVVTGTQFHPEKSGPAGLRIYANLVAASVGERRPAAPSLP